MNHRFQRKERSYLMNTNQKRLCWGGSIRQTLMNVYTLIKPCWNLEVNHIKQWVTEGIRGCLPQKAIYLLGYPQDLKDDKKAL